MEIVHELLDHFLAIFYLIRRLAISDLRVGKSGKLSATVVAGQLGKRSDST